MIALRARGEPDAFPAGDLGLCQALQLSPRPRKVLAPWRAYAAAAIWPS
jgi:3-methyladenine DNA glycosylase/8-oxoguanine DNA glycosylase